MTTLLSPAREPGTTSSFEAPPPKTSDWNIGREKLSLKTALSRFMIRPEFSSLGYQTRKAYAETFKILQSCFSATTNVHEISPEQLEALSNDIRSLPLKTAARLDAGETLDALLSDTSDKIAAATANRHINNIKMIWKWLSISHYVKHNCSLSMKHPPATQKYHIHSLSDEDIVRIFITHSHDIHGNDKHSMAYWLPWLGLFTGARRGELVQLSPQDIRSEGGIHVLRIETNGETDGQSQKRTKTPSSARIVPIHSKLIKLGFLDFAHKARGNENQKLFSELTWSKTHHWSNVASKFQERKLHPIMGGRSSGKTFHSFRHTVNNRLLFRNEVDPGLVDALLGWSSSERLNFGRDLTRELMRYHYGKEAKSLIRLNNAIETLDYPVLNSIWQHTA